VPWSDLTPHLPLQGPPRLSPRNIFCPAIDCLRHHRRLFCCCNPNAVVNFFVIFHEQLRQSRPETVKMLDVNDFSTKPFSVLPLTPSLCTRPRLGALLVPVREANSWC
jgi:hypothetical protein